MGPITMSGLGSNLKVGELVGQLVALERKPIETLNVASDRTRTKISAFGKIQSALEGLRTASAKLGNPALWQSIVATSSDPTIATVSGAAGQADGNYTLNVAKLASTQNVSSAMFGRDQRLGGGTLKIELGAWAEDGSFKPADGKSPSTITIEPDRDSLADVRDKINAADAGVLASVVNDARGARLVVRSKDSGADNGFRLTGVASADAAGQAISMASLSYLGSTGPADATRMGRDLAASNAELSVNGLEIRSATNSLESVIDGMTINLLKPGELALTARPDKEATKKAITEFVTAYNGVINLLRDNVKYDAGSKVAGTLQGDSAAIGIQDRLRRLLSDGSGLDGTFQNLYQIGLSAGVNGTLTVSDEQLNAALGKRGDLKQLFMGVAKAGEPGGGIATRLRAVVDEMLGTDGVIQSRTQGLQASLKDNARRVENIEDRAANLEKRLYDRYTSLDKTMSGLGQAAAYLSKLG